MDKKRIEIIITAVLVVIFLAAWANTFKVISQRKKPAAPAASPVAAYPAPVTGGEKAPAASVSLPSGQQELIWGRDPFSGRIYAPAGAAVNLDFKGVLWDEKRPQALIGEEIVSEGDRIGKYTVVRIKKDAIVVNDGVRDAELKIE